MGRKELQSNPFSKCDATILYRLCEHQEFFIGVILLLRYCQTLEGSYKKPDEIMLAGILATSNAF